MSILNTFNQQQQQQKNYNDYYVDANDEKKMKNDKIRRDTDLKHIFIRKYKKKRIKIE